MHERIITANGVELRTEDPVLPYGHGVALAREIPGATLLTLAGTGHEINRGDWDTLIAAILRHTDAVVA